MQTEKVKRGRGRPKKEQVNGKLASNKRSIDEILGFGGVANYKETEVATYEQSLKNMTLGELQDHALNLGVKPIYERGLLIGLLVKEFVVTNSKYYNTKQVIKEAQEAPASINNILRHAK